MRIPNLRICFHFSRDRRSVNVSYYQAINKSTHLIHSINAGKKASKFYTLQLNIILSIDVSKKPIHLQTTKSITISHAQSTGVLWPKKELYATPS